MGEWAVAGTDDTWRIVIFHPLAEQELLDGVSYYEEQENGLRLEYLGKVEHAVNVLIRYSEAGSNVNRNWA